MFDKSKLKERNEYLFLFGVGGLYLFATTRAILSATVIFASPLQMLLMGMFFIVLFTAILFNKVTRIASAAVVLLVALFLVMRRETLGWALVYHINDVALMATGYMPYDPDLGRTLLWLISIALSFTVVVFMLYQFNFYVLFLGGGTIFALSWLSSFVRDSFSFLLFLFAFMLILMRHMTKKIPNATIAAPFILAVIMLVQLQVPAYSEMFQRRTLRDAFEGRFNAVEDFFFELFNPTYFSFAATGFSGTGGRLGGPVTPSNRHVMEVNAPGVTYLSGAMHNHFTGDRWQNTLEEGDLYTHGFSPGHFEMLEQFTALLRGAGMIRGVPGINASVLRAGFPSDPVRYLHVNNFAVIGTEAEERFIPDQIRQEGQPVTVFSLTAAMAGHPYAPVSRDVIVDGYFYWLDNWLIANPHFGQVPALDEDGIVRYYWHMYLPMETVSIALGRNRTGTVFRPPASRQVWFDYTGPDYLPVLTTSEIGDKRAPGFMGRGTIYHHHFMHINPEMAFIRELLQNAGQGFYAGRYEIFYVNLALDEAIWDERLGVANVEDEGRSFVPPGWIDDLFTMFTQHGLGTTQVSVYMNYLRELLLIADAFAIDVLAEYAAAVRRHFMYVPEITPQRVHDLTHHVIRYAKTDFERVTAIRDFLLNNFPYTLDTMHVPRGVCFVDHFLFVGQQGYCTYYATAMAIMARIAGVPSRYIEGFMVPGIGRHDYSISVVTNRMAHAWVEVYLEGFGWLKMEATPPYAFDLTGVTAATNPQIPGGGMYRGDPSEWRDLGMYPEDWLWFYMQYGYFPWDSPDWTGTLPGGFGQGPRADVVIEEPNQLGVVHMMMIMLIGLITVLVGILFYFIMCRVHFNMKLKRIAQLSNNQQAQIFFKGILAISEYYHIKMEPEETTFAYSRRAGKRFAFRGDAVFLKDLIALYNRAKFGHKQISDAERELMKDSYFIMHEMLRSVRWRVHYVFLRDVKKLGAV